MPRFDAEFVAGVLGATLCGNCPEQAFNGVSTDSRAIEPGQLFVALEGPNFDGHDFVESALADGAAGALVRKGFKLAAKPDACLIQVDDTTRALGDLAGSWRREHSALVAAITGSNGKTTTKEMLAAIMSQRHRVLKTQGNLNNHIGLPLTLLKLSAEHTACVVEMGMNAPGEIARLTEIAEPEVGVITNVGPAHLGMLGSMEAIAAAKAELLQGLTNASTALVNMSDPMLAPYAGKLDCNVLTFGLDTKAEVRGSEVSAQGSKVAFNLDLPTGSPLRVVLAAPGRHNVMNALAAAATAWALGQGAEAIKAGLEAFTPVKGRLQMTRSFWGFTVLDDTYNANPASLAAGLNTLKELAGSRRKALILGDMRELGPTAPQLHEEAGRLAAELGCQVVLALGERAAQVEAGARAAGLNDNSAQAFDDFETLVWAARDVLQEDDVVLIKGSRSARMERVVAALTTGEVS
jgi:UDP-N-acetylmuramoyl-tripeptide--D-alanyl-D-alanine ligase